MDTLEGLMLERLRMGLLPWAKDKKLGYTTINARVETVASKPAFRTAFKERRALVPMAGYFDWTELKPKIKPPHGSCIGRTLNRCWLPRA